MVLMTPERTARLEELTHIVQKCNSLSYRFPAASVEEIDAARKAAEEVKSELQTLMVMKELDTKLAEALPFLDIYQSLKPDAVVLTTQVIDEIFDFFIQVSNNITKYQEIREAMARSTRATYEAYLAVGFNETQAFALTVRTLEIFDEQMKKITSGIKVNNKS